MVGVVDLLHDLADAVGRAVAHAQAHYLLGLARHLLDLLQRRGQDPDQAGRGLRVEALVGGVGEAGHGHGRGVAVHAGHRDPHPYPQVRGGGERRLHDRAQAAVTGPEPAARGDQRRGHGGLGREHGAQLHRGLGGALLQGRGSDHRRRADRGDPGQRGELGQVRAVGEADHHVRPSGAGEQPLPRVGRPLQQHGGEDERREHAGDDAHGEDGLDAARPQVGPDPAKCGRHSCPATRTTSRRRPSRRTG